LIRVPLTVKEVLVCHLQTLLFKLLHLSAGLLLSLRRHLLLTELLLTKLSKCARSGQLLL
jgi:hypothetical protein